MAKKANNSAKKGKKDSKAKKGQAGIEGMTVVGHPRASAHVRRAKGAGGVGGFAIAAYVGAKAGIPPDQLGERSLAAGILGYMLAWGCSVTVWRHLMLAELRARYDEKVEQQKAARAAAGGAESMAEQA